MPQTVLWMGTEHSHQEALELLAKVEKGLLVRPDDDEEQEPAHFSLQNNVAIVPVKGPLTNADWSWWQTTYTDVRNGLIEAASDPRAQSILLDIDSGGGSAHGALELGALVRKVDSVKPVHAYTGGAMESAAYAIGSSASKIFASPMSEVGSIGVIAVHMEQSKMLQEMGVKPTVVRAGKFKALATPYEPLSDTAKQEMQAQLDTMYGLFVDHVAQMRGVPTATVKASMAEGRVFLGQQAVDAGLVDKIASLDDVVAEMVAMGEKRKESQMSGSTPGFTSNDTEVEMAKKARVLDEKAVAALSAGAAPEQVLAEIPETTVEEPVVDGPKAEVPEASVDEPEKDEPKAEAVVKAEPELVTFLRTEMSAKDDTIFELRASKKEVEAKLDAMTPAFNAMRELVSMYTDKMRIAMGGSAVDMGNFPVETLLQEHAKVRGQFEETFPVGGRASVRTEAEQPKGPAQSALDAARLRANTRK